MKEKDQVIALAVLMLVVAAYLMMKPPAVPVVAETADAGSADASEPDPPEWVHVPAPTLSLPPPELTHPVVDAAAPREDAHIDHGPSRSVDASDADASF